MTGLEMGLAVALGVILLGAAIGGIMYLRSRQAAAPVGAAVAAGAPNRFMEAIGMLVCGVVGIIGLIVLVWVFIHGVSSIKNSYVRKADAPSIMADQPKSAPVYVSPPVATAPVVYVCQPQPAPATHVCQPAPAACDKPARQPRPPERGEWKLEDVRPVPAKKWRYEWEM